MSLEILGQWDLPVWVALQSSVVCCRQGQHLGRKRVWEFQTQAREGLQGAISPLSLLQALPSRL